MKAKTTATTRRALCAAACLTMLGAHATEGGGSTYPMGAESYMSAAMPPAGVYTILFANRYRADELKDRRGDTIPLDFNVTANVLAPRLIWVHDATLFGGQVAQAMIVPLVDLDVAVNGARQKKQGVGDIIVTALALGYHHSAQLHSVLALDILTPSGSYSQDALANLGRHYWAIEPVYTVTRIDPAGLNWDVKLMYDFNLRNKDTGYRSGQELHADYSLGYGLGNNWVVGVGGYAYAQTTDDRRHGLAVADNRGRAYAIGPALKYDTGKGFFVTLKYQKELGVRNRAAGSALWLKATIAL
ncbi:MAG: transporter [Pseudomonadota bacterium]